MSHSDTTLDRLSMSPRQDPSTRDGRPGSARFHLAHGVLSSAEVVDHSGRNAVSTAATYYQRQGNSQKGPKQRGSTALSGQDSSLLQQTGPPVGSKGSDDMGGMVTTGHTEPPLVYCPPDVNWQRKKAKLFGLAVRNAHFFASNPCHTFPSDCPPKTCEQVAGDGNCLFRSISFWITGSEDHHLEVREVLVQEIHDNSRLYSAVTSNHSITSYIRESQMNEEGVWGSEVEIFVAATLLQTPIAVFAAFGERYLWQVFKPLRYTEPREKSMLYLHNSNNHFEPVIEV